MATRRNLALLVGGFVVVCSLAISMAVVGTKVTTLATALGRLLDFSEVLKTHVAEANLEALAEDLVVLDDLTQDLTIAVSDPVLGAAIDGVPVVGSHLQAARLIASATAGLTAAAKPLSAVLPRLDPTVLVTDGRYDVETFTDLDDVLRDLQSQLKIANSTIASISLSNLDSRFANFVEEIGTAFSDGETLVAQIEPLVGILPIMLGGEGNQTWFIALQNLAESRGTGGLLSAYAVLEIADGSITMSASGSDGDLKSTVPPLSGVPNDYLDLWGSNVTDWLSVNVSPHFPYAGRLISNTWAAHSGQDVDGVLAFGQGIVQYMLAAVGPVEIDGSTVDASNVVKFLSLDVYAKYPDADDKNEFVAKLVAEIFSRLQVGEFDLESLLASTSATPTSDRLQAWAKKTDVEAQIVADGYGGAIPNTFGPTAAISINNGGGNKLEQFLAVTVDYSLGECSVDPSEHSRAATMTVTLTNNAPTEGLPEYVTPRQDYASTIENKIVGSNLEVVSIYLPVGAEEGDTTLDGEDEFGYVGVERDRNVLAFDVDLDPGETKTLVVPWVEPTVGDAVVDVLSAKQSVITPPSLNPIVVTTPAASSCK
jgi:hypothetical protein